MEINSILASKWYYTIEMKKGVFTEGLKHRNLALTRKLLRNVRVQDSSCIDIGTQEAVIPILLKRGGAKRVIGYDRYDLSDKIKALIETYQVDFEYMAGIQLPELPKKLDEDEDGRFFDLVVFSGVLYHMVNPLGLMALVRGLCKIGGLFLIETAAVQNSKEMLIFNARGEIYGPSSNYFIPTTAWLDYTLRMLGLMPLQAVYMGDIKSENPIRLAVLCRSQGAPCPLDQNDTWALESFHAYMFDAESQFNWEDLAESQEQLDYYPYDESVLQLKNKSLYGELQKHPRYIPSVDETILKLDSTM